jgi:hypothetical protein
VAPSRVRGQHSYGVLNPRLHLERSSVRMQSLKTIDNTKHAKTTVRPRQRRYT